MTTDSSGNLASDGGAALGSIQSNSRAIDENSEGIAIALAAADPDLVGDESFGLRINFGEFSGESAIAFSAMGVVGRNVFGSRGHLAVGASVGVGLNEGEYGGRLGVQLTW